MLAKMTRNEFETMDDASLIWACVKPIIARVRGRDHSVKENTYAQLSDAQRALMMFQVLRGHSSSGLEEFFRLVPHLPSREGIWRELIKTMLYFGDDAFAQLLREIEADYRTVLKTGTGASTDELYNAGNLMDDPELLEAVRKHDQPLREAILRAEGLIAARIRRDMEAFAELQD